MKNFTLFITCVNAIGVDITEMVDNAREVTYKTLAKQCDLSTFDDLYSGCKGLSLANDYSVSFYKSKYKGKDCYFVDHSAIEHVFLA